MAVARSILLVAIHSRTAGGADSTARLEMQPRNLQQAHSLGTASRVNVEDRPIAALYCLMQIIASASRGPGEDLKGLDPHPALEGASDVLQMYCRCGTFEITVVSSRRAALRNVE